MKKEDVKIGDIVFYKKNWDGFITQANEEIININYNGSVYLRDKKDKMQKINDPDVTDT